MEREGQDAWLRQLAAEEPDAAGIVVPERAVNSVVKAWQLPVFTAFDVLRFDRQYFAFGGEAPISYSAISRYADDHGIAGDALDTFRLLLAAVDEEWIAHQSARRQ